MSNSTKTQIGLEDKASRRNQWVENMLELSSPLERDGKEEELIEVFINAIYREENDRYKRRLLLAAAFDLIVAAEYYRSVAHGDWVYCPEGKGALLFYPYTNACPRCALQNEFVYHSANKPRSGSIGAKTSRLLALFLEKLFKKNGKSVEVRKGSEPVDIVLIDNSTNPRTVFFGEIKAAPLVTLPLAVASQRMLAENDNDVTDVLHKVTDNTYLYGSPLMLFVPVFDSLKERWEGEVFSLGEKRNAKDALWAYRGLANLFTSNQMFLRRYLEFWRSAHESYAGKSQDSIYWLLNASGQPSPRPDSWPQRSGASGYESISDSKTSVGMDRTDDLKKGTYQVLKMGAEGKPASGLSYKVGIISNIHALRHFDDYLEALKDVIWTRDEEATARKARDLDPNKPLFNLFDGIIALTETVARDEWVREVFDF